MPYILSQLYIYPIKSLAGISLHEAELTLRGLKHDRRWMLVDESNRFISQREQPKLCLFTLIQNKNTFSISYQNEHISIPIELFSGTLINVTVWDDNVAALVADEIINNWFSKQLNQPVRLVYMHDESIRPVDTRYATNNEIVSFADAYPLLVIGESSLQLLQSKITESIPMNRFRPNIVFSGGDAHDEDSWVSFSIQQQKFSGVKPCARCMITTIDQYSAIATKEPLKTLATYRQQEHKILFGQNVIAHTTGSIQVGDTIEVIDTGCYLPQ